jgi:hypothetical protein
LQVNYHSRYYCLFSSVLQNSIQKLLFFELFKT